MNMSFMLTLPQMVNESKTETRRLGWRTARVGQIVQPVEKAQGLKKGEKVVPVGRRIRFTSVRQEPLHFIQQADVIAEGFPDMTPPEFVAMFCAHNRCKGAATVTVLQFERV